MLNPPVAQGLVDQRHFHEQNRAALGRRGA
jgi:hypothetical protein